jgi:hypothetical protein
MGVPPKPQTQARRSLAAMEQSEQGALGGTPIKKKCKLCDWRLSHNGHATMHLSLTFNHQLTLIA